MNTYIPTDRGLLMAHIAVAMDRIQAYQVDTGGHHTPLTFARVTMGLPYAQIDQLQDWYRQYVHPPQDFERARDAYLRGLART